MQKIKVKQQNPEAIIITKQQQQNPIKTMSSIMACSIGVTAVSGVFLCGVCPFSPCLHWFPLGFPKDIQECK